VADHSANLLTTLKEEGGRLIANPTSVVAASNYGGTVLGEISFIEFRFGKRNYRKTAEEKGGATWGITDLGDTAVVAGVFRGADVDALGALFPNTVLGSSRGRTINGQSNGTVRAGADLSERSIKLLFAPDDSESGLHVILYRALPVVPVAASIGLHLGRERGYGFAFEGTWIEDTKRSVYQHALRENLTITPT
jgi:hypothetical protein